ncbi:unnamed protein product [Albugo candida]|uniref:Tubulin--tyrosine ligase-like protein 9 n=1 Tax=Albugo candida TaxID=65357 RepID=A0A024G7J0_9STRA|nr:unnamed protein product [Albugo candida]|eukprot:CCI42831.1 unnamed protein product [Albugo candida]
MRYHQLHCANNDESTIPIEYKEPLSPLLPKLLGIEHKYDKNVDNKVSARISLVPCTHLPQIANLSIQPDRHSNQIESQLLEKSENLFIWEQENLEDKYDKKKERISQTAASERSDRGNAKCNSKQEKVAVRHDEKQTESTKHVPHNSDSNQTQLFRKEKKSREKKNHAVLNANAVVSNTSRIHQKRALGAQCLTQQDRDFETWKKRNGVCKDQKVFCVSGCYPIIRQELEKRGWFYNEDRRSCFFHLKWSLKSEEIKMSTLHKHQYVNHFLQNTSLTTKVGLLRNLRHLVWHQSAEADSFFPQAFDLNEPQEMNAFIQQFRYVKAESMLKKLAKLLIYDKNHAFNLAIVDVILAIARKQLRRIAKDQDVSKQISDDVMLEESIDHPIWMETNDLVSDLQWEVLNSGKLTEAGKCIAFSTPGTGRPDNGNHNTSAGGNRTSRELHPAVRRKMNKEAKINKRYRMEALQSEKKRIETLFEKFTCLHESVREDIITLAISLEKKNPQFHLNGGGNLGDPHSNSENIWIIKPAGMSRGRGIRVFNELDDIFQYTDIENHKECQWIAQKYMENPFLVCRRKFDIRQWVLVTCWDPLTVWFNKDCYLRFSSEEYQVHDLSDPYVHLTNNSIQKQSDKFHDIYKTEDGNMVVEGNMWHSDDFIQYLQSRSAATNEPNCPRENIWEEQIQAGMKRIVIYSLQCVQEQIQHRPNSFELYGYDFMLDDRLHPWLIEVNSSPACDYSTPTARRYVETGLADIIKVIVDYRQYEQHSSTETRTTCERPSTGCWVVIHRAAFVGKPSSSFGADFHIKGKKLVRRSKYSHLSKRITPSINGKKSLCDNFATEDSEKISLYETSSEKSDEESEDSDISNTSKSGDSDICIDTSDNILSSKEQMLL